MAQLPRGRAGHLRARALGAVAACLLAGAVARAGSDDAPRVDLEGTWYVLVHHGDADSPGVGPSAWEDALWTFARRGARLHWTVHPTLRFQDDTGRSARDPAGRRVRTAGAWEPSDAQRAEIARGLRASGRGVLRAVLEGSDAAGWATVRRDGLGSAGTLGFSRRFAIEGPPGRPVFTRSEVLAGASADALEGGMRFETRDVGPDGVIRGRYARDGERVGRFRMWRAGPVVLEDAL